MAGLLDLLAPTAKKGVVTRTGMQPKGSSTPKASVINAEAARRRRSIRAGSSSSRMSFKVAGAKHSRSSSGSVRGMKTKVQRIQRSSSSKRQVTGRKHSRSSSGSIRGMKTKIQRIQLSSSSKRQVPGRKHSRSSSGSARGMKKKIQRVSSESPYARIWSVLNLYSEYRDKRQRSDSSSEKKHKKRRRSH